MVVKLLTGVIVGKVARMRANAVTWVKLARSSFGIKKDADYASRCEASRSGHGYHRSDRAA